MRRPNLDSGAKRSVHHALPKIFTAVKPLADCSEAVLLECLWQCERGEIRSRDAAAMLRAILVARGAILPLERWRDESHQWEKSLERSQYKGMAEFRTGSQGKVS